MAPAPAVAERSRLHHQASAKARSALVFVFAANHDNLDPNAEAPQDSPSGLLSVRFGGQTFESLDAASKVLSYEEMASLVGCRCKGMEWDRKQDPATREKLTEGFCNCLNQASLEPCGKPVMGYEPQDKALKFTDRFSETNTANDLCGWSQFYTDRFLANKPFSVARYNDGEWLAMELGESGAGQSVCPGNIDEFPCGAQFTKRLRATLNNKELLEATWPAGVYHDVADFDKADFIFQSSWDFTRHDQLLEAEKGWNFKQEFWLNDIIHGLVREHPADLTSWMLVLGDKNRFSVLGVGPKWLHSMAPKIPYGDFVEIFPEQTSAEEVDQTIDTIEKAIAKQMGVELKSKPPANAGNGEADANNNNSNNNNNTTKANGDAMPKTHEEKADLEVLLQASAVASQITSQSKTFVCLLSASMMSNVIISDLFSEARKQGAFLIDIGSGFDPLINDSGIHRRTGTQAQELYKNPSKQEVARLVNLMAKIDGSYEKQGLGKPYFLEKPWKEMTKKEKETLATKKLQAWVQ